jgi:GPH family glycoside/pentoside/hexuronide:cation symporter
MGRGLLFLFALPAILQSFMQAPAQSLLQGIYAKESGLALTALGAALLAVRLLDLCSDLLIGFCSDRSMRRGGSRKRWIAAGMVVSIIAIWFLFRPPTQISIAYYAGWFLLANIGWSLIEIPYKAWTLEYAPEPTHRTRIVTWVAFCAVLGAVLFYAVGPIGKALGLLETAEPNMQMLRLAAVFIAVLLPLPILLTLWRIPDHSPGLARTVAPRSPERFTTVWPSVVGNSPLLKLLGCVAVITFFGGLPVGVLLLYLTNYLGLSGEVNAVLALSIPISMLGLPIWGALAQRYPRQRVWAFGMLIAGISYASLGLVPPNSGMAAVAIINCVVAFGLLSTLVAAPVIMGDVIDYGREKVGVERAGLYMSLQGQVVKGCGALAGGASLMLLGYFGFDAASSGADITPQAVSALKWVVAWLPGAGFIITGVLLWTVPISKQARDAVAAEMR